MPIHLRARIQDWAMRQMDELRSETVGLAHGDVLEVGFGTGLNLARYGSEVRSLVALDPLGDTHAVVEERIAAARFPVERHTEPVRDELPFETGRFDCVVTTWTLCSIRSPVDALREMRRVLKPGGRYVFVEHGRSDDERTARWQDRLNPFWCRFADGCNMNRAIDDLVSESGFGVEGLKRFRGDGPRVLAEMYRGVARRSV
jgi:ubiquinone/menaquinone biosynthesis C-methylase UbiE